MNKGLTQVAFGVIGAAMLSGSVFAAGPTILPIPDVVVTDRDINGDFDSPDPLTSANIYRFTGAFPITDFIGYTPVDGSDTVSFLWTEHDNDPGAVDGAGVLRSAARTLTIGGIEASTNASIDATAIAGAPSAYQDLLASNPAFDIVNTVRSGGDGTNPGPDPGGPFVDLATVKIYVAASAPSTQGAVATRTFNVFTTNDTELLGLSFPGDQYLGATGATTIFTPITSITQFGGWRRSSAIDAFYQGSFDPGGAQPINPAITWNVSTPPTNTPGGVATTGELTAAIVYQVAPAGTNSLAAGTLASPGSTTATAARPFAPQFAFWRSTESDLPTLSAPRLPIEQAANPADDNIYMIRWNVSATNVPFAQRFNTPDVRFQVGENSTFGVGVWKDEYVGGGTNSIRGAGRQHRQYFIAETTTDIALFFSTFDLFQASLMTPASVRPVNYSITLDSIDVYRVSRSDLAAASGNPAPVFSQGAGAGVTVAAGQKTPPAGVPFSTSTWSVGPGDKFLFGGTDNFVGQNRVVATNNGSALNFAFSGANYSQTAEGSTFQHVLNQLPGTGFFTYYNENEIITGVRNDQLVVMDAWLSSSNGNTANNNLPTVRLGLLGGQFGGTSTLNDVDGPDSIPRSAGRAVFREFEATNRQGADAAGPIPNFANLQTTAKRYTTVIEPQVNVTRTSEGAGTNPTMDFRILITPFAIAFQGDAFQQSGNITVNHIAVYVYDLPEDPATLPAP